MRFFTKKFKKPAVQPSLDLSAITTMLDAMVFISQWLCDIKILSFLRELSSNNLAKGYLKGYGSKKILHLFSQAFICVKPHPFYFTFIGYNVALSVELFLHKIILEKSIPSFLMQGKYFYFVDFLAHWHPLMLIFRFFKKGHVKEIKSLKGILTMKRLLIFL